MKFVIVLFVLFLFCRDSHTIFLNEITIPPVVLIDGEKSDTVVLDCNYDVGNESISSIVVKWFKDDEAVYQWIRGNKPSVFPHFKNDIEADYVTSVDSSGNKEYRGLALKNVSIDSAGVYKCVVQTTERSYSKEQQLRVVDISNYSLNLNHHTLYNETQLECTIVNIYPEPILHLSSSGTSIPILSRNVSRDEYGLYNAIAIGTALDNDEPQKQYECTVTFTDVPNNFTVIATTSGSFVSSYNKIYLLIVLIMIIDYN